jgi:hypothetical protein
VRPTSGNRTFKKPLLTQGISPIPMPVREVKAAWAKPPKILRTRKVSGPYCSP